MSNNFLGVNQIFQANLSSKLKQRGYQNIQQGNTPMNIIASIISPLIEDTNGTAKEICLDINPYIYTIYTSNTKRKMLIVVTKS